MTRIEHAACGYSEYAPGCDDDSCLLHRIEVSAMRGWDASSLQSRLDSVVDVAASFLLGISPEPAPRVANGGQSPRP